jgi:hypothetical protein
MFVYHIKSPSTGEKYLRLENLLDFLNLQKEDKLEDKAKIFTKQ